MMRSTRLLLPALVLTFAAANAKADILTQFHGTWVGTCDYTQVDGSGIVVNLTLVIEPVSADTVTFGLTYTGEPIGTLIKNYEMRAIDVAANHYVLDENNGILIDHYLFGDRLMGSFDVGNDIRLAVSTEVDGDSLHFENAAYDGRRVRRTRSGNVKVDAYAGSSLESCDLTRD